MGRIAQPCEREKKDRGAGKRKEGEVAYTNSSVKKTARHLVSVHIGER